MITHQLLGASAQRALEQFSEEFTAALAAGAAETWASDLGFYYQSNALKTTYPVPIGAAGYRRLEGDLKYRKLSEKSLDLVPVTWQDGVSELASVVEAPDFIGWMQQPAAFAAAAQQLPNRIIAELLEDNPASWTGQTFFHDSHPVNVLDGGGATFDNDLTCVDTSPTELIAALSVSKSAFRRLAAPSYPGDRPLKLGLRTTHLLVPPELEESWRDALERDLLIDAVGGVGGAVDNRHKGTVQLIVGDELTDSDVFYALALNKPGMFPWIVQDEGSPEEIIHDRQSSLYKTTLKIGMAYVLRGNGVLALPHCAQRFTIGT